MITPDTFSRVQKLLVDRDGMDTVAAKRLLAGQRVILSCGPEVCTSPTFQAAVLTAANIAHRCFPGAVRLSLAGRDPELCVPWPTRCTLAQAVNQIAPPNEVVPATEARLVFGTRDDADHGLRVTFDGWSAAVAPIKSGTRLAERDFCVLAGVAAASLAVSEVFFELTRVTIEATRRTIGLSLWRPDLPWESSDSVGVPVEFLPSEMWLLGLGHLGQAYAWGLGLLPYSEPYSVRVVLNDFDAIVQANLDTGLLSWPKDIGSLKTRVAAEWLEGLGFATRLIERAFDEGTHRKSDEPGLALCGFDGPGPRYLLDQAGFLHVIECGLGGTADDCDILELHSLGVPSPTAESIWPTGEVRAGRLRTETEVLQIPAYRAVRDGRACGHMQLAGLSIGVPFVGAIAASLVLAEALRILHQGERFQFIRFQLSCPGSIKSRQVPGGYRGRNVLSPRFQNVQVAAVTVAG